MKKERIIRKGLEFTDIINNGKYVSNAFYSIYYINKKETLNRFGISVPKKIGHAVVRNKIKRQLIAIKIVYKTTLIML